MLRGRIDWNDDFSDTEFDRIFVIDGRRITLEAFGRLFEPFSDCPSAASKGIFSQVLKKCDKMLTIKENLSVEVIKYEKF
jgi:hypothetical protein